MRAKIVERQSGAMTPGVFRNRSRQGAAIEGFAIRIGDQFQRAGMRLRSKDFPSARRASVGKEAVGETRLFAQHGCISPPQFGNPRRDGIAVSRMTDSRRRDLRYAEKAKAFEQ